MSLDPKDWDDFRAQAHRVLDACVDHLESASAHPWRDMDDVQRKALAPALPKAAQGDVAKRLINDVLPFATGNIHPQFFGWVHGTGLASGLMAEIVAATMNSNCGGRNHGAIEIEQCVIDWSKQIFSFPDSASGLLTVGTSQATIIAMVCARTKLFGLDVRKKGISVCPNIRVYCREGTHSCVAKALEVMGHGSDCVVKIATQSVTAPIDIDALKSQIDADRAAGYAPMAIVGTAGSVNVGAFDNLNGLADFCADEDIWLHVDGAFGAWARIADAPWSDLAKGIEHADSLAFDFHKWMSVQYDCGAVLIRDGALHYDSFTTRPAYLTTQAKGLASGDVWPCDLGTDLSRGFRALKVWTSLMEHGLDAFSDAISENCRHAAYMAELVEAADDLVLAAPVISNVCTFRAMRDGLDDGALDALNSDIVHCLQMAGKGVFSTTIIDGRTVIRAAIVNHRTTMSDIDAVIGNVIDALHDTLEI